MTSCEACGPRLGIGTGESLSHQPVDVFGIDHHRISVAGAIVVSENLDGANCVSQLRTLDASDLRQVADQLELRENRRTAKVRRRRFVDLLRNGDGG